MFEKKCPICNSTMTYKSKSNLNFSIKNNRVCKNCKGIRVSEKTKGIKKSEDHKKKLSEVKIGKKLSEEHKHKIGLSGKGKKRSEESRKKLSESKKGNKNPAKNPIVRRKISKAIINLYKNNPEIKERISNSLKRYFNNDGVKLENYKRYRDITENLTNKNRKKLFEIWDGYDYYDGEYIKSNLELHYNNRNYPTIDHKISIIYGFENNMTPEELSSIENLCITKRSINSKKGSKIEEDYLRG